MRTIRDSAGTETPSVHLSGEGPGISSSSRFFSRIRTNIGQASSSKDDSGAAVVEMAFIFSILVMLLVGVVTSAIAFGQKNSIENAAREASRYAATYPPPSTEPDTPDTWREWLGDVRDVARAAAQNNLDAGVDGQYICVSHVDAGEILEDVGGAPSFSGGIGGMCYDDGLSSDRRVQVITGRDTEINAAFFSVDVTLNAPATARYEREE